jgi:hypothetical protein
MADLLRPCVRGFYYGFLRGEKGNDNPLWGRLAGDPGRVQSRLVNSYAASKDSRGRYRQWLSVQMVRDRFFRKRRRHLVLVAGISVMLVKH